MAKKCDLVSKVHNKLNYLAIDDVEDAVNLVIEYLSEELTNHKRIEIRGFGSFSIRMRKFPNIKQSYNSVYYRMSKDKIDVM